MTTIIPVLSLALNVVLLILVFSLWNRKPDKSSSSIDGQLVSIEKNIEKLERSFREEMTTNRSESSAGFKQNREELTGSLQAFTKVTSQGMGEMFSQQKQLLDSFSKQLSELTVMNEQKFEHLRAAVEKRLEAIQKDNNEKLEQMRVTVDEKLQTTLEKRLGESFKIVSERLEQVHKGLGEMQTLAQGVGSLQKVLSNVKTRGTLGEIQLENILEQTLTVDQYDKNVITKEGSNDRVEFAVKIPDKQDKEKYIYLPIDSKFPIEDYQRLLDAESAGDIEQMKESAKQLENRIKKEAKSIQSKYLGSNTCDFALLFVPVEGMFAQILRTPGLFQTLQRDYQVIVTGPTTLTALLNSLQMGFKTLAIQERSSEVWRVLGAVKSEFGNFTTILTKVQKKLQEANNVVDTAFVRSRAIERGLRSVEELPSAESKSILQLEDLSFASSE